MVALNCPCPENHLNLLCPHISLKVPSVSSQPNCNRLSQYSIKASDVLGKETWGSTKPSSQSPLPSPPQGFILLSLLPLQVGQFHSFRYRKTQSSFKPTENQGPAPWRQWRTGVTLPGFQMDPDQERHRISLCPSTQPCALK